MNRQDHADAFGRLCREVENRYWWEAYGPLVRFGLALAALMLAAVLVSLSGDCGDLRPAHADPEPAAPIPLHPDASQETRPTPRRSRWSRA